MNEVNGVMKGNSNLDLPVNVLLLCVARAGTCVVEQLDVTDDQLHGARQQRLLFTLQCLDLAAQVFGSCCTRERSLDVRTEFAVHAEVMQALLDSAGVLHKAVKLQFPRLVGTEGDKQGLQPKRGSRRRQGRALHVMQTKLVDDSRWSRHIVRHAQDDDVLVARSKVRFTNIPATLAAGAAGGATRPAHHLETVVVHMMLHSITISIWFRR